MEHTKRSPSGGERSKSNGKKCKKDVDRNRESKDLFNSFISNPKEFAFLTKTFAYAPSNPGKLSVKKSYS